MPRFSPSGFFGPSKRLVPTLGLTSECPTCSTSFSSMAIFLLFHALAQPNVKRRTCWFNTQTDYSAPSSPVFAYNAFLFCP